MKQIIYILLFLPLIIYGQKIKYLPEPFYVPISFDNQKERDAFVINSDKEKKGVFWLIVGDRDNITLLAKPNGKPTGQYLRFKETAYVIDENKEWIKIGVGRKEDNKFRNLVKSGWVKKKDVLLWTRALINQETHLRTLAIVGYPLSNLSDFTSGFDKIKIYDGPSSSNIIDKINDQNVFYIFKEEQQRILIGTADFFTNNTNVRENIMGWVNKSHVEKWNGRLALECNWEEPSYGTRRNDPNKRVYGFIDPLSADLYSKTGSLNNAHIMWDNDPAKSEFPKKLRSEEITRRPVGDIFRFPVLDVTHSYVKSLGTIKLDEDKMKTEPIKNYVIHLSEETQNKIRNEKPSFLTSLYLPKSILSVEQPYKYVIFMSEVDLEDYRTQLQDLQRAMSAPEDMVREQLYNTVISIILKMSGDKMTRKQIDNMHFREFMGLVIGMNRECILLYPKGISIKDILNNRKVEVNQLNKWSTNLTQKERKLSNILKQRSAYPYSYLVGDAAYFWIDLEDLDWSDSIK